MQNNHRKVHRKVLRKGTVTPTTTDRGTRRIEGNLDYFNFWQNGFMDQKF